jgi:flagellar biosynthesis protein FlhA
VRRVVVRPYLSRRGDLAAFFLDPSIEQALESSLEHGEHNSHVALSPSSARDILDRIIRSTAASDGASAVITSSGARYALRQLTEASLPRIAVLSHGEIPAGIKVISLGMIQ